MENTNFFLNLSELENSLQRKPALAKLLMKTFEESSLRSVTSTLQRSYLITAFSSVYHHFGFEIFSPLARHLFVPSLANISGTSENFIELWLESLCYQILEDFAVLNITAGEPNWKKVDEAFALDLVKRLLTTELPETRDIGLSQFDQDWVGTAYSISSRLLNRFYAGDYQQISNELVLLPSALKGGEALQSAFETCFERLRENPLRLLAWRLEAFSAFCEASDEARFFARRSGLETESVANAYAAFMALLLPHVNQSGKTLMPESPVTLKQMLDVLNSGKAVGFDLSVLRNWLRADERELPLKLGQLARGATKVGLVFEVQIKKNQKAYGLSRLAMRILKPFENAIRSVVVSPTLISELNSECRESA